jgi:hypothetical protein
MNTCVLTFKATVFYITATCHSYMLFAMTCIQKFCLHIFLLYLLCVLSQQHSTCFTFNAFTIFSTKCCHFSSQGLHFDPLNNIMHWNGNEIAHWLLPITLVKRTLSLATGRWHKLYNMLFHVLSTVSAPYFSSEWLVDYHLLKLFIHSAYIHFPDCIW